MEVVTVQNPLLTLEFICGAGMMIHGFDAAVADMEVGDGDLEAGKQIQEES